MFELPVLTHATVTTAKPSVHPAHPFRDQKHHQKLLGYLQARLLYGRAQRDRNLPRYAQIDKDVAGWMQLSDEDKDRQREHFRTGMPQAVTVNLPLNFIHLDDMMTYFAETFAPNRGMFYHTAKPDSSDPATQIVTLMNNHAIYGGMYRQTMMAIFSILKYNLGGFYCRWSEDYGPRIERQIGTGEINVENERIWAGNKLDALDMYNTFYDPSVHPVDLHKQGEWAARAMLKSHYWLASRAEQGTYFNCDQALENDQGVDGICQYFRSPPREAMLEHDESGSGKGTNWMAVLSEAPDYAVNSGFELVEIIIRLNPNDFGLVAGNPPKRNHYEIWRFTILNDKYIIEATHMANAHGQIPYYFGLANDDVMGPAAKSPAEIIQPLQDFASSLLNTHILANRKKIWGLKIYDPTVVDFAKIPEGSVAAYIACEATGYGRDISKAIWSDSETVETKQTMSDLGSLMEIINQFFPTQAMPSAIANIDRAVDSQVAAVQQGSNRRQHKTAKLLDDSLFRPVRASMYYNIIQYQEDNVEINDFTGSTIKINLEALRQTDLPFIIGQGLKAIDRMMIAGRLQQVIFALIQSPRAGEQTDILALIDYWTTMLDIDIDFKQFRLAPPQQGLPGLPGGPPMPGAEGPPIQPAIDPAALTQPLKG